MAEKFKDQDINLFVEIADHYQSEKKWDDDKIASMIAGKTHRTILRWKKADYIGNDETRNQIRLIHSLIFDNAIEAYYPENYRS